MPGRYDNAGRESDLTTPGLEVGHNGHLCAIVAGRFVVERLEWSPSGPPLAVQIRFEQRCQFGRPALHGVVRWESQVLTTEHPS